MSDDQSTKLFKYVQKRFDEAAQDIENVRQQVGKVYDAVDSIAKQQEIDQHERLASSTVMNTGTIKRLTSCI